MAERSLYRTAAGTLEIDFSEREWIYAERGGEEIARVSYPTVAECDTELGFLAEEFQGRIDADLPLFPEPTGRRW